MIIYLLSITYLCIIIHFLPRAIKMFVEKDDTLKEEKSFYNSNFLSFFFLNVIYLRIRSFDFLSIISNYSLLFL